MDKLCLDIGLFYYFCTKNKYSMKQIDDLMPLATYSCTKKVLPILQIKTILSERFPFCGVYHYESASEMV